MKIWEKCAALGLLSVLAACGSSSGTSEKGTEQRQATLTPGTVTLLSIASPAGVPLTQTFLSGSNSLTVDDRVTVAQAGQLPAIDGLGTGGVQLGANVIAHANVYSGGTTVLRSNLHVFGAIKSVGVFNLQSPIQVDGGKTSGVSVVPVVTTFGVTFPTVKAGDQTIGPDGPVVSLAPGAYGAFNLRSRGKVLLHAGKYYFDSFSTEPQAQLQADPTGGTTFIFVANSYSHKSPITSSTSAPANVVVGYLGTSLAYLQAGFPGVLMAPNATVELHRPDIGTYAGAFFAKDLHVFSDTAIAFAPIGAPILCALGDTDHCSTDPVPDSDGDGTDDLHDGCPLDPKKIAPGICHCGTAETDSDHDGIPDCIEFCNNDPNNTFPGACGCAGESNLQPAGKPCTVEACSGSGQQATCDGHGQCGVPACFPPENCVFKTFGESGYLICSGAVSWAQAKTLCQQEPGRSLVEVDDRVENLWLASVAGDNAWLGANDLTTDGQWAWSVNGGPDRRPFWDNGLPVPFKFVSWHSGAPSNGQCVKLGKDGTWTDANCTETRGFVCEQPLRRLPPTLGPICPCQFFPGISCDSCGKTDNVDAGPCVPGSSVFPSDHVLADGGLDQDANFAETQAMAQDCHDNCTGPTDPNCATHCTGFAAVPPSDASCKQFSQQELALCDLVPSSVVAGTTCTVQNPACPSGSICGHVYDCAALDGNGKAISCATNADCASGQTCDPRRFYCLDPNRTSACADKDANGKCVGVCFGRFACGQPGPDCPIADEDTLLAHCSTTEICPDPQTVGTVVAPDQEPGSNLTPATFVSTDVFPNTGSDDPQPLPYDLAGPPTCGGPGQAACHFDIGAHPWCNYVVNPNEPKPADKGVSDKSPPFNDKQGQSGGGGPISFSFDPNLEIGYHFDNPLALGDTNFGAHAKASAVAAAHFSLFHIDGEVDILNANGELDVDRCGFNDDATLQLFGIDFLPFVLGQQAIDDLNAAKTPQADRDACAKAIGEVQKVVDRAQKSLRDAQELVRQEKAIVSGGGRFSPDLCHQLLEAGGKGIPPDFPTAAAPFKGCGDLSPEDTVNLFIRYYRQQVISLKDQLSGLLANTLPTRPSFSIPFADDVNKVANGEVDEDDARRETQQIANFNFAIGPIPMNLTIDAYVQYGVAGNLTLSLNPQAVFDTIGSNNGTGNDTSESLAKVDASFTPFAGAGVSMFLGVGFDFGALSAKVGISGDVSLGLVLLPLTAGAGIRVQATPDDRPLPADLQGMVTSGNMIYPAGPPRKFRFDAFYDFGLSADIEDILLGTIYGKLRIKFFWFSKTWQKQIAQFGPAFPAFKKTIIGGEGDVAASGTDGFLGFLHMPIQFADLAELPTPDALPPLPPPGTGGGGAGGTGGASSGGAGAGGSGGTGTAGRPPVSLLVQGDPRYMDFDPSRVDRLFYAGYCECSNDGACTSNLDCCGSNFCDVNDDTKTQTCLACAHTSTFEHQGERCGPSEPCCAPTDNCEPYGVIGTGAQTYCQPCVAENHAMKTHNGSNVPDFPNECCPTLHPYNGPVTIGGTVHPNAGPAICTKCRGANEDCNGDGDCCPGSNGSPGLQCLNNVCGIVR